jgi:hypothetical protein
MSFVAKNNVWPVNDVLVHSLNPVGKARIKAMIRRRRVASATNQFRAGKGGR